MAGTRKRTEGKQTGIGIGLYLYIRKTFHDMASAIKREAVGTNEIMAKDRVDMVRRRTRAWQDNDRATDMARTWRIWR
jgi:hypothetical protein